MNKKPTALVAPCFLDGEDGYGNNRIRRNQRWVNYYTAIQNKIGFDDIWLLDNSSTRENIDRFLDGVDKTPFIQRFSERLVRREGMPHDYPYYWRALWFIKNLFVSYDKIICIDSDCFVLTERMASYIKNLDSGWTSFWCKRWNFPDSSIWVLTKPEFDLFLKCTQGDWSRKVGECMERDIPFTYVNKDFCCSRFGEEIPVPLQDSTMDMYGQAHLTTELMFGKYAL